MLIEGKSSPDSEASYRRKRDADREAARFVLIPNEIAGAGKSFVLIRSDTDIYRDSREESDTPHSTGFFPRFKMGSLVEWRAAIR
jgi:hypothetical protein